MKKYILLTTLLLGTATSAYAAGAGGVGALDDRSFSFSWSTFDTGAGRTAAGSIAFNNITSLDAEIKKHCGGVPTSGPVQGSRWGGNGSTFRGAFFKAIDEFTEHALNTGRRDEVLSFYDDITSGRRYGAEYGVKGEYDLDFFTILKRTIAPKWLNTIRLLVLRDELEAVRLTSAEAITGLREEIAGERAAHARTLALVEGLSHKLERAEASIADLFGRLDVTLGRLTAVEARGPARAPSAPRERPARAGDAAGGAGAR